MTHRHETSDMNPKYVFYFGVGLLAAAVVIHAGIWGLYRAFEARHAREDFRPTLVETPQTQPPEPRLQLSPARDYQAQKQRELEILNSYGWVDREKGTARIPIDRAMEILVERGVR